MNETKSEKVALLRSITLLNELATRCGSKKEAPITFKFEPGVNLLVGPNGSGKSTILSALTEHTSSAKYETDGEVRTWFLDFEKSNPRVKGSLAHSKNIRFDVACHFRSHGEVVQALLNTFSSPEMKGCLALTDEPDMALDLSGIKKLQKAITNCQAAQQIITCHSPFLMLCGKFNVVEMRPGYLDKVRKALKQ
jgi:predicted ATPase